MFPNDEYDPIYELRTWGDHGELGSFRCPVCKETQDIDDMVSLEAGGWCCNMCYHTLDVGDEEHSQVVEVPHMETFVIRRDLKYFSWVFDKNGKYLIISDNNTGKEITLDKTRMFSLARFIIRASETLARRKK